MNDMIVSKLDRHITWLRLHHSQSAGAARSVRAAINNIGIESPEAVVVAEQKRKAADNAATNAAHFHEIAELLTQLQTARRVLRNSEAPVFGNHTGTNTNARHRFIETVDRLFGF